MMKWAFLTAALVALFALAASHTHHSEEYTIKSEEHQYVTCGSTIKLRHVNTGVRLHSHEITYGTGSGQQSVTGLNSPSDDGSYWAVREGHGQPPCAFGQLIERGSTIRLQHVHTERFLHTHHHQSPLTQQQEVSAFGERGHGDSSDDWIVRTSGKEHYWLRGEPVRFQHKMTKAFLDISGHTYRHPIPGQFEVVGNTRTQQPSGTVATWIADEGFYFPRPDEDSDI